MPGFASGLSYEQLKALADAGAIDKLSKGSMRKNGNKWQAQVSYRTVDRSIPVDEGHKPKIKRVFLTHTFSETQVRGRGRTLKTGSGGTDDLFERWRAQVISDAREVGGYLCDPSESVQRCIERYISDAETRKNAPIRKSTSTNYRYALKRITAYSLANRPLLELTTEQVQQMVDEMGSRLARKTIKASLDLLSQACKATLGTGVPNPCDGVRLPDGKESKRAKKGIPNALTVTGVEKFNHVLDSLDANPDTSEEDRIMSLAARLCLQTGMRSEEVTALRFGDIEFGKGGRVSFNISHAIERFEEVINDENGNPLRNESTGAVVTKYYEADTLDVYSHTKHHTKTRSSRRVLSANKENSGLVMERYKELCRQIASFYPHKKDAPDMADVYLLGGPDGSFASPRRLCKRWLMFAERSGLVGTAGVTVGLHDLRHTCASRYAADGMRDQELKRLMGHSSISLTKRYYVSPDDELVAESMYESDNLFGVRPKQNAIAFNRHDRVTNTATGVQG